MRMKSGNILKKIIFLIINYMMKVINQLVATLAQEPSKMVKMLALVDGGGKVIINKNVVFIWLMVNL